VKLSARILRAFSLLCNYHFKLMAGTQNNGETPSDSNHQPPHDAKAQPAAAGAAAATNYGNSGPVGMGRVLDLRIERELQDSYLTYAMSTIMDRALPDIRDGLKPSQRRILVAMNDLKLYPGKKHIKCAKICGDTSGNYHPHGDAVIYPTLVNMGQNWRMRTTLIDPQGNFGSVVPDPPAAMRYTEARMTAAAADMLEDLLLGTVDFQPNFDARPGMDEPTVLPGKFPNLLINGAVGIAVGMATSLAPNNPTEVLDSIIRTIDNPAISLAELMQDEKDDKGEIVRRAIKGPDFPSGGFILGRAGLVEAYSSGRGKVTVRGRVKVEPVPSGKDRQQLVINQMPYNVSVVLLEEQLKEADKDDRITDISAVYNESNSKEPVRIVIELKKGSDPGVVEKQLYEYTSLQQNVSMQNIALVNRQPRTLPLTEMIRLYIDHRVVVIRRRTAFLLNEARKKAHILEGLIYAVCDIDEVIRLIRSSRTRQQAIDKLMEKRFRIASDHRFASMIPRRLMNQQERVLAAGFEGIALTRVQAEAIGALRLIQLTGLEIEKLTGDYAALVIEIEGYEAILADMKLLMGIIRQDCLMMRAKYDSPRMTEILEAADEGFSIAALIPVHEVAVTISHQGYAKRVPLETYRTQGRGGKGIIAGTSKEDDYIDHMLVCSSHDELLTFTDTGRVFKNRVFELPEMDRTSKGRPLVNMMELKLGEKPRAYLAVKNFESGSHYLLFTSQQGIVKRTALKSYMNVNKSGLIAVDIRPGDRLLDVMLTTGGDDALLITASGMAIRFAEDDAREMGRGAGGVKGIDLADDDEVIGSVRVPMVPDAEGDSVTSDTTLQLLTITANGYGKRTAIDEYRVQPESGKMRSQSRGGKGRADIVVNDRNGRAVVALGVHETDDLIVVTKDGQLVRTPVSEIRVTNRATQGVRIVSLNAGDEVVAASVTGK